MTMDRTIASIGIVCIAAAALSLPSSRDLSHTMGSTRCLISFVHSMLYTFVDFILVAAAASLR